MKLFVFIYNYIFCDSEFFHGYNWEIKKQKLGHNREYWIKKIHLMERNGNIDLWFGEAKF